MIDSPEKDDPGEGRLAAWSRRKRAVTESELAEPVAEPVIDEEAQAERQAQLLANRQAAEAIDLESLTYESDFAAFLKDGVPTLLRRQALRILWRSDPTLAVLDGLNDYDLNYADPKYILTNFQSAWQIGKGYLKKEIEKGREDARQMEPETEPEIEAVEEEAPAQIEPPDDEPLPVPVSIAEPEPEPLGRTSLRSRLLG